MRWGGAVFLNWVHGIARGFARRANVHASSWKQDEYKSQVSNAWLFQEPERHLDRCKCSNGAAFDHRGTEAPFENTLDGFFIEAVTQAADHLRVAHRTVLADGDGEFDRTLDLPDAGGLRIFGSDARHHCRAGRLCVAQFFLRG